MEEQVSVTSLVSLIVRDPIGTDKLLVGVLQRGQSQEPLTRFMKGAFGTRDTVSRLS